MPELILRNRETWLPNLELFKQTVVEILGRSDLSLETRADLVAEMYSRGPRATIHDASIMMDFLGGLVRPDGESWRDPMTRYVICQKLYPLQDSTQDEQVELTDKEVRFIASRLNDRAIKMRPLHVLMGIFVLEMIDQLNIEIETAEDR